jgi:hypothetical protein
MIEVLRDSSGNITAVCEWNVLDERGIMNPDGRFLLIGELEINKDLRGKGLIVQMIKKLRDGLKGRVDRVAFVRGYKYPDRKPSVYAASRFGG